jgi:hypothetical protein
MAELIPISIIIADRSYRIRVEPQDEATVRRTVKFINDKVMEFKGHLAGKDMQDYVSMALIWFATQPANTVGGLQLDEEVLDGLARLESLVDKGLGINGQEEIEESEPAEAATEQ